MKKIIVFLLVCMMAVVAGACSNKEAEPTVSPSLVPSVAPSDDPTEAPTEAPSDDPTEVPTENPNVTSTPDTPEVVIPDVLQLVINSDGTVSNGVTDGPLVESYGEEKTVSVDATTGLNVVTFPTTSSVYDVQIGDYYTDLEESFTMEVYFKLDAIPPTLYQGIVENCEAGGFGLYVFDDASIKFYLNLDGEYAIVTAPEKAQIGRWYHCVCVWDGNLVQIYMDGQLVDEYESGYGFVTFPSADTAWYLSIAGCCTAGIHGNAGVCGSIGICNLYTTALTADQITSLYIDLIK